MKHRILLMLASVLFASNAFGTTYMITASGMTFTPDSITINLGDTVMFMWSDGFHTTTSTTIPATATAWTHDLTSTSTSYTYVPSVVGTYHYQCNIHVSMGMIGKFIVVAPTGVSNVSAAPLFTVSPNPATQVLHVQFNTASARTNVIVTDMSGKSIFTQNAGNAAYTDINISTMPAGMYLIKVEQDNKYYIEKVSVVH